MSRHQTGTVASRRSWSHRAVRRPVQWVLLYGSRRSLTLLLSAVIFCWLLAVGTAWQFEMETLVRETRAVQTLFNTLLGGVILFVSVVLSINIAALSQEFAPLQVKQAQIEDSIGFQIELEKLARSGVSPAGLRAFFWFILQAIRAETEKLRTSASTTTNRPLRDELLSLADRLEAEVSEIEARLRTENQRISTLLLASLEYDYARDINATRRIQVEHGEHLSETESRLLQNLTEILTFFASGREYYATLYFKRELRNLSSDLLVLSLPVIVFTSYVLLAIDAGLFPTLSAFGIQPRLLYISLAFVVALSPYVLLSSYMLRIVTVSKYSLESTGFTLNEEELFAEDGPKFD
ncbi:hypothetical protein SAMN04487950_3533 [Halogranum rubrum]|uniref:Uncharacterized protein n=1 Tax=Halogranum rubrum TaxID=553466 RepID=A0A1I4H5W8_9EURY|nr:hypothetical protein [Halogranum rubrum]SFL37679.1 hypothetical protein SAMN04487950_3533 [Halogranum rubrum]